MAILYEFLVRLASLDLIWLISLVLGNLFWVFTLTALAYYFFRKVPLLISFIIVTLYIWSSVTMSDLLGWELLTAGFLAFTYLWRVAGLTLASTFGFLRERLALVSIVLFLTTFFIWNVFLVG